MWNNEVILIDKTFDVDADNQQKPGADTRTTVLCKTKSIGRREFYSAAQIGLQLDIVIVVKNYEYEGQKTLIFNNKEYKVVRTYSTSYEEIDLMCRLLGKND